MSSITKVSFFGIPAIIGLSIAWVGSRIIKNEKELKHREIELQLQIKKIQ